MNQTRDVPSNCHTFILPGKWDKGLVRQPSLIQAKLWNGWLCELSLFHQTLANSCENHCGRNVHFMSAPVGVWNTPNIAEECVSNGVKGGNLPLVSQKLTNCHLWQKSGRVLKVGLGRCNMWAAPPPSPPLKAKRLLLNYGPISRAVIDLVLRK